jgi:hypothetical protein
MEVSVQLHTLAALLLGIGPQYLIGLETEWALQLDWILWRREKLLPLPGIEPWLSSIVAIPTKLSWLLRM